MNRMSKLNVNKVSANYTCTCNCALELQFIMYKGVKTMLKDVGITVPKSRETSAVYAARQRMRACKNTNMRNPIIKEM